MKETVLPHEKLYLLCRKTVGKSVWAIGMSTTEKGDFVWEVYCDNEKKIKKLPKTFQGGSVQGVFCEKPDPPDPKNESKKTS